TECRIGHHHADARHQTCGEGTHQPRYDPVESPRLRLREKKEEALIGMHDWNRLTRCRKRQRVKAQRSRAQRSDSGLRRYALRVRIDLDGIGSDRVAQGYGKE